MRNLKTCYLRLKFQLGNRALQTKLVCPCWKPSNSVYLGLGIIGTYGPHIPQFKPSCAHLSTVYRNVWYSGPSDMWPMLLICHLGRCILDSLGVGQVADRSWYLSCSFQSSNCGTFTCWLTNVKRGLEVSWMVNIQYTQWFSGCEKLRFCFCCRALITWRISALLLLSGLCALLMTGKLVWVSFCFLLWCPKCEYCECGLGWSTIIVEDQPIPCLKNLWNEHYLWTQPWKPNSFLELGVTYTLRKWCHISATSFWSTLYLDANVHSLGAISRF